ncbi:MAG: hypothetical protein HQL71_05220 [Magnetococcales bacterium]|nr:hypothetical protein [Magnetococcales bacterium]
MRKSLRKLVTIFVVPLMVFLNVPITKTASAAASGTKIVHEGIAQAVSGNRLQIQATVTDPSGIDVVRTYFKAAEGKNFNFVAMKNMGNNQFAGTLPAPAANAGNIDYLILAKNSKNVVVKSQTFQAKVVEGSPQESQSAPQDPVQVYSELAKAPTEIAGFADNIVTDVVVSAAKFGVVAGVVSQVAAGGSAAGAGAVSAGTTTATASATTATATTATATATTAAAGTAGMSTAALAGLGAVALGGAAYAVAGGSSDDSSSESTSDDSLSGSSGVVRFNLATWNNSGVDLDLHVTDPCGNEIYYSNTSASCNSNTGSLDVDDTGSAGTGENIVWTSSAASGTYYAYIRYFSGSSSVSFTLTAVINGETSTRTGTLSSGSSSVYSFTY